MRYYGKIHSKLPIFRVKSVKIYTGQKKIYTSMLVALVTNIRYVQTIILWLGISPPSMAMNVMLIYSPFTEHNEAEGVAN